ncbi:putative formin-like protein 14 [Apostichopus japonicus]|uniref:Putative formin-like protein 14 n=1 Tax=Stichopus japonicus TaxID=307972 RepID=A0A2G8JXQ2_STIJA|nr:putative formin-like protein 14 [Apostichopus japonicus]
MKRRCYSKVLFAIAWVSILFGCILLVGGLYIKIHIEGKMNLIEGYNSNILLIALLMVGVFLILLDLVGGKLLYDIDDISRRKTVVPTLMLFLIFLLVLNLLLFSTGLMCFIHQIHLRNSFHDGLLSAMSKYSENDTVKVEFDLLQIEFTCCGNDGYEDWFDIQWISNMYLNLDDQRVRSKMASGHYLNDDVPFSCCNPRIHRPCIHHHVHDDSVHFNYNHADGITLHTLGCKQSLMEYFSKRLQLLGALVFIAFLTQMFILLGFRILQTSMVEAEELGDSEATTIGYLFRSSNTSAHKDFKDVEGIVAGDEDFDDDSTFDDEDFEEENKTTAQQTPGPPYENSPLMQSGSQRPASGEPEQFPEDDGDDLMDGLPDEMPEGKKKSSSKKSTKSKDGGRQSTVKKKDKKDKKIGKEGSKSKKSPTKSSSTKSSPKSSKKKPTVKSMKKRSPSKPKSPLKGKSGRGKRSPFGKS